MADASIFRTIAATRDDIESVIRDQVALVRSPGDEGWERRLSAALTLPLTGASAVLVGLAHLTLASTDESEWNRIFSKVDPGVGDAPVAGLP